MNPGKGPENCQAGKADTPITGIVLKFKMKLAVIQEWAQTTS